MKEETKVKIKKGWEKAKMPVIVVGTAVGAYALGFKRCAWLSDMGLEVAHNAGIVKMFDPKTGCEVWGSEAVNVLKDFAESMKK